MRRPAVPYYAKRRTPPAPRPDTDARDMLAGALAGIALAVAMIASSPYIG